MQELLAAYRTLDVTPQASTVAVAVRYRELCQVHDPDRWPPGSPEQLAAAARVRAIDAAFDLVKTAPLLDRELPDEPAREPAGEPRSAPAGRAGWLTRVDIDPLVWFRFFIGMGVGRALGYWLGGREPLDPLYAWPVAIAMGIVFARTSRVANLLLRGIVRALRR